jgi:glycosyltransferase involved in cell wall biosynthesis
VADRLRAGKAVRPERLHVIPNLVDLPQVAAILAAPPPLAGLDLAAGQPFALFVGKLEPSKGAHLLPEALHAAGVGPELPVVFAGSGPLQAELAAAAQERWLDFRFADWLDNADVLRLMHAATVLLFPSAWDEPLSRVLLEACGVGATILALNTGGTPDILTDGVDGRLVADMDGFTAALRDLLAHPERRARLAAGARATAERRFAAEQVVPQVEALYRSLL